ncbi:MAG: HdaA/DnaA family protein [Alphaproteobacteria bacterium]
MTTSQLVFDLPNNPGLEAEDYLITDCNNHAVQQVFGQWPHFSLYLQGESGAGKSHLAHIWQHQHHAIIFNENHIKLAEHLPKLPEQQPYLLIEDIPELLKKRGASVWLFHLYNLIWQRGGHLLLTGRIHPAKLAIRLKDLRSRLRSVPVAVIYPPDDAMLAALLVKHFRDRQLQVDDAVISFILGRMERSFAAAAAIPAKLDMASLAQNRPISVNLAKGIMDHDT